MPTATEVQRMKTMRWRHPHPVAIVASIAIIIAVVGPSNMKAYQLQCETKRDQSSPMPTRPTPDTLTVEEEPAVPPAVPTAG
eukprot:3793865-Pyramimonas_sp.AAC.1